MKSVKLSGNHGNSLSLQTLKHKRSVKMNMTNTETEFACDFCGKKYDKKYSLNRHVKSHQPGVQRCGACNMFFENTDLLLAHKEKSHQRAIRCVVCEASFARKSCLRKHMMRAHPESCRTKFKCMYSQCVAVFDTEDMYKDHLNIHKGLKPYVCNICGKPFPTRMSLRNHELRHAKVNNLGTQCDNCGKTFTGSGALHNHIMSVHKNKRYRCELCNKVFVYRSGYSKHVASHKKDKSDGARVSNHNINDRENSSSDRAGLSFNGENYILAGKQYLLHSPNLSDQQQPENTGETDLIKIESSQEEYQSVDENPAAFHGNIIKGEITLTENDNVFQKVDDKTKILEEFSTLCVQSGSTIYTVAENGALRVQEHTSVNTGHLDTCGHLVWMFKS